jgi:HEAT repeat protein
MKRDSYFIIALAAALSVAIFMLERSLLTRKPIAKEATINRRLDSRPNDVELKRDGQASLKSGKVPDGFEANSESPPTDRVLTAGIQKLMAEIEHDPDGEVASELGNMGPAAVAATPALIRALSNDNAESRAGILNALGKIGEPAAIPAIILAMNDNDRQVRAAAANAAGMFDARDDILENLKKLANDESSQVRKAAFESLGIIGGGSVKILIEILKNGTMAYGGDTNMEVRCLAAEELGKVGRAASDAVPVLMEDLYFFVNACDFDVIKTIGMIGNTAELLELLDSDDTSTRQTAIEALGNIGPEARAAVPRLMELYTGWSREFSAISAEAIGRIKDPSVAPRLEQIVNDPRVHPNFVLSGHFALALMSNNPRDFRKHMKPVYDALTIEGGGYCNRAVLILGELGDPSAIPFLSMVLESKDPSTRFWTIVALGKIGSPAAIQYLEKLKKDDDPHIRDEAEKSIKAIEEKQFESEALARKSGIAAESKKMDEAFYNEVANALRELEKNYKP